MIVDIKRDNHGFKQAIITIASSTELAILTVLLQKDIEKKIENIESTTNKILKKDLFKSLDRELDIFREFIENKENSYPEIFERIDIIRDDIHIEENYK